MTTRYERLNPLYDEYIPEKGDVVMFRHAPYPGNQRQQYTVTDVFWHLGKVGKVRVEFVDFPHTYQYDLNGHEFEHLDAVKVGRTRRT